MVEVEKWLTVVAIEVVVEVDGMVFEIETGDIEEIKVNMGNVVDSFHKILAILVSNMYFWVDVANFAKELEHSNYSEIVERYFSKNHIKI